MTKKIKQKDIDNMLKYGDFCRLTTDKLTNDGLKEGTRVFIAGTQVVPISADDLYTQRIKLLAAPLEDNHINSAKIYLIDPNSVKRLGKRLVEKLKQVMEEDFAPEQQELPLEEKEVEATH